MRDAEREAARLSLIDTLSAGNDIERAVLLTLTYVELVLYKHTGRLARV